MDHESFIRTVQEHGDMDRGSAEAAIRATLETLAERIAAGEAEDLAEQLPPEVARWLPAGGEADSFGVEEFVRRVARREGVDLGAAERHAKAVFTALELAVSRKEYDDMVAQLSKDYGLLLPEGPPPGVVTAEAFLKLVADRGRLDAQAALRAADAVLETLGERISGGEVDDLAERLAFQLRMPLNRGRARSGGKATPMSLDEFVRRVAEREGTSSDEAREHARAVFAALREAVGDQEFRDVVAQLPREYATLGAGA